MKAAWFAGLVACAALAAGHPVLDAADIARLRYVASIYFDAKGAGLNLPEGVACGSSGQVIVADTGNDRLLNFTYQDKTVTGGSEVKIPQLAAPYRVRLNSKGEIYALDGARRRIVHIAPDGAFKDALAFDGVPPPSTIVPKEFTIDGADNIYVLDVFSARVLVLSGQAQFQKTLAFPDAARFGSGLAVDAAGAVFLFDAIERRLFTAPKDAASFAPLGGDLREFVATLPTYLTVAKGVIFVVEGNGSSIVALGSDGSFLARQLAGGWTEGALNHPSQMCINDRDEVFIADRDNSRVQIFQLTR